MSAIVDLEHRPAPTSESPPDEGYDPTKLANGGLPSSVWSEEQARRDAETKRRAPRIEWMDAGAIFAKLPEVPYLVPGLRIPGGGTAPHMWGGYGFSGKSVVLQAAILATAAGRAWWGVHSCPLGKAVFFSGEQGQRLDRLRFQRLARGHSIDPGELEGWLRLAALPSFRLTQEDAYDVLCRELEGVTMAAFDSYRSFCPGVDENDSRAREPLDMLGRVSEATGCACHVVHHARKAQKGDPTTGKYMFRGSSGLFDAIECGFAHSAEKGEPIAMEQVKARSYGELVEDFSLRIVDVTGDHDPRWGLRVEVLGKEAVRDAREATKSAMAEAEAARLGPAILAAVASEDLTSVEAVAKHIGKNTHPTRLALRKLESNGILAKKGAKGPYTLRKATE